MERYAGQDPAGWRLWVLMLPTGLLIPIAGVSYLRCVALPLRTPVRQIGGSSYLEPGVDTMLSARRAAAKANGSPEGIGAFLQGPDGNQPVPVPYSLGVLALLKLWPTCETASR